MKKIICMLCAVVLSCITFFYGCAGTKEAQNAISNKDYQMAREQIEKMKDGEEKNRLTEEYEDALFADVAQLLNNKDYVAAHEEAQQSISGKAMDATQGVILSCLIENISQRVGVVEFLADLGTTDAQLYHEVGGALADEVRINAAKDIIGYLEIQNVIPRDIIPIECFDWYDKYIAVLKDSHTVFSMPTSDIVNNKNDALNLLKNITTNLADISAISVEFAQSENLKKYDLPEEYDGLIDSSAVQQLINGSIDADFNLPATDTAEAIQKLETMPELTSEPTPEPTPEPEPVYMPLEIEGIRYDTNSIGTPEIYIRVKNTGDATIDAFDFAVKCLNNYGEIVKGYGHEPYSVCTYQGEDGNIGAGEVWSASENDTCWTMYGYDTATKYEVAIIKVHTTDGETITLNQNQYEWIPQNE